MSGIIQSNLPDNGSRLDQYWNEEGFSKFYKIFRSGIKLPSSMVTSRVDLENIAKRYHLKGFQFGNWVTIDDRYNYLASLYVCLYDLNKVLKFPNHNMGFGVLGISFGSRGHGSAVAHFEPLQMIINLTRYSRESEIPKLERFVNTGGVGAFAHEYGHFLDFFFGYRIQQSKTNAFLSGGNSISRKQIEYNPSQKLRIAVETLLQSVFWTNGKESNFIYRIKSKTDNTYWLQRNEIFARIFEQYINYKLQKMGIYNSFISQHKYNSKFYLNSKELQLAVPKMDEVIKQFRTLIN